jgi:AcrR family transcriptional regulator
VETHRREVRDAILDATWALVAEHGLLSVTMSKIAEQTGISRATVYRYFPDVEAILDAHHERHVSAHLDHLRRLREQPGDPNERLEAVLLAYARICRHRDRHGSEELAAFLHRRESVAPAQQQVLNLFRDVLADVAAAGGIRTDVPPGELSCYCFHALSAAGGMRSDAAVRRLVAVTLAGLRPPSERRGRRLPASRPRADGRVEH